jgi:purine-binding chemotaxis protein CheW
MSQAEMRQFTTFHVENQLYGVDVLRVQEVTSAPRVAPVPLSPPFVAGLVNIRGQVSTALALRTLFGHAESPEPWRMSVVCRSEGDLISLLVDSIGDVVEVEERQFERLPDTIPWATRRLLKGVYKLDGVLLSVLDLDKLNLELNQANDARRNP